MKRGRGEEGEREHPTYQLGLRCSQGFPVVGVLLQVAGIIQHHARDSDERLIKTKTAVSHTAGFKDPNVTHQE
jgi:hypothetical protein